ncbi:RHS repeat-associated core domain-containing protein [Pseudomonas synxantha]|uniref:Rhs family protein n=1 Tax=Pseudomonas synxantha TaxID=47883 RepID=A0AAU8TUS2_9PSED|nr:RHS repeat-associated core domain-containing protein [Pseudomonas synxantha]AKA85922.1 Rhs family protein [Pseudomonas synxantha]
MFEAARWDDEIVHTSALTGFLIGAAIGLAMVAFAAIAIGTGGLGACLLIGLLGALGPMMPSLGESIGKHFSSVAGHITTTSRNVFINGKRAAIAKYSELTCDQHTDPLIAEGSFNVFINSFPAARKGDKTTCGATIDGGSPNVFIGGGRERYLPVNDEVPAELRVAVDVLMVLASLVRPKMPAMSPRRLLAAMKAAKPCIKRYVAGYIAGSVLENYVLSPALDRAAGAIFGNPVDATNGRKILPEEQETDFILPGLMPIHWSRFYASDLNVDSALGRGWVLPWEQSLHQNGEFIYLSDNQGRSVPFVVLEPGERIYSPHERLTLVRSQGGHYLLQTLDNTFFYFGEVTEDGSPAPLLRIENALGHYIALTYNEIGQLTDVTASGGWRMHLHYEHPMGRLTEVKRVVDNLPVETLVRYSYDANGQLNQVINRNGDMVRQFVYEDGLMVVHRNALGLACQYRWQHLGGQPRVVEHWASDGEHYHFTYDLEARTTRITDVLQREAQVTYNHDSRVIASRDFGGEHYTIDLDDCGNLVGLTLPGEQRLAFQYDEYSRLIAETDPLGRTTEYRYHFNTPLVTRVRAPDGGTWQADYDRAGNLICETDAVGQVTRYANGDDGLPHTITDPLHKTKTLSWNAFAQLTRYQDCSGKVTTYRYDDRQHLIAVTDALSQATQFQCTAQGEVLRIEHPDGSAESFEYNPLGQVMAHTDGAGHVTRLHRNARGLPTQRRSAEGQRTHYEYDKAQRLVALINENNATYRFDYDSADRLVSELRVDQLQRQFTYNASGHLLAVDETGHDDSGERPQRRTDFERDAAGRLLSKITAEARHDYHYDDADRLLSIARQPSQQGKRLGVQPEILRFSYDPLGRLIEEAGPQGTLGYHYDPLDNLSTLTLPDGRALNHLYYGSGHLHQINLDGQLISDIERDDLHREVLRSQGRLSSCFGYDVRGRKQWQFASRRGAEHLSRVLQPQRDTHDLFDDPGSYLQRRYHYDKAGELASSSDRQRGATVYAYLKTGDLLSRSTKEHLNNEHFETDPAGNRLAPQRSTRFGHIKDNRLRHWQQYHYRYDAWGNVIERRSATQRQLFEYDSENRLVHALCYGDGNLQNEARYQYDSLGRRTHKQVEIEGALTTTQFLWQGLRLLQETCGGRQQLYIYEPDSYAPLARVDRTDSGKPSLYYFHTDQIGTPLEVTTSQGDLVWQARYKAWGDVERFEVQSIEQPLRFQGQYFDAETGLHYNTFRYYDPGVGRFTTQDPIGLLGGDNLYQYAVNPTGWVDPLGLTDIKAFETYEQARKAALKWLEERGFQAEKETLGRFGDIKGKPVGMQTSNGKVGFRVEYDDTNKAHINTWAGKEKGPHFNFNSPRSVVSRIQRTFSKLSRSLSCGA